MKIQAVDVWRHDIQLSQPYTIAYETVTSAPHIFLRLQLDDGVVGLGCAVPDFGVTGERAETAEATMKDQVRQALLGSDPFTMARIADGFATTLAKQPSVRAGVDMALYDALAKRARLPLYKLLGGFRTRVETSVTIGICDLDTTLELARSWSARGFRILKIKGGRDLDLDIERIRALRSSFGDSMLLRFDANQGYSVDDAVRLVHACGEGVLELIEQPTTRDAHQALGEVTRALPIPVMADETVMTSLDAFALARDDLVDILNIKLMKVGGIAEAMRVNAIGRVADISAMIGCMDECELAISAGLHLALALPNISYVDLDGHLDLAEDPSRGAFRMQGGWMVPRDDRWGLGVDDLAPEPK